MFDFSEKVVVVIGAVGNLGKSVAERYLAAGATLALVDRSGDKIAAEFPALVGNPSHLLAACTDMTDPAQAEATVSLIIEKFGRIDIFVNTVGGYRAGTPVHETDLSTWDFMMDLNAKTFFIAAQKIVPHMLHNGSGKIVAVSARPGLSGNKNMGAYSASKAAVLRLIESMSKELRSQGINVNCILPGTIDTPQNRDAQPGADTSKWVTPESLAGVILFLTSDHAQDIHGAALPVYGKG